MTDFKTIWKNKKTSCRIGTTSYIIPDDIIPNLHFLKDCVEDVELVLFESDEFSNLPAPADVRTMKQIADDAGLSFTVHLPLDALPGAEDENIREKSAGKWLRVMDRMARLSPFGWIVHLNDPPDDALCWDQWLCQCAKTVDSLLTRTSPEKLCIETLSYDFSRMWPLLVEKDCSVCMDIGHLLMTGRDVTACLDAWMGRTRVIHLHGVREGGRDHVDISHIETGLLKKILAALQTGEHPEEPKTRVLTMEIFSQNDFERSVSVLKEMLL